VDCMSHLSSSSAIAGTEAAAIRPDESTSVVSSFFTIPILPEDAQSIIF
jgi:hypothetical protein